MTSKIFPFSLFLFPFIVASCNDDDAPYVAPEDESQVVLTAAMADSIWEIYADKNFVDAQEAIPSDSTQAYYEDYVENWLSADEETRDIVITYNGDTAIVNWMDEGKKTKEAVKITAKGAHVIIRNEKVENDVAAGRARMNYILRGSSNNGSLRIYSNKKFMVTLDGVSIANAQGAAINVQKSFEKKRMFLNIAEGTVNTLADATQYTDTVAGEDEKGAIFSEGKLILMGKGKLTVTGNNSHAIAADDRILVHAGVQIQVTNASKDAIHAKDEIVLNGGRLQLFAQKDALQCDSLAGGLILNGAQLIACGHRAVTAGQFSYKSGSFCLVANDTDTPTSGLTTWTSEEFKGYKVAYTIK